MPLHGYKSIISQFVHKRGNILVPSSSDEIVVTLKNLREWKERRNASNGDVSTEQQKRVL